MMELAVNCAIRLAFIIAYPDKNATLSAVFFVTNYFTASEGRCKAMVARYEI